MLIVKKIKVTGSIKFDIQIDESVYQQAQQLRTELGDQRPVWIAASTHSGEDEQVLAAHKAVLVKNPDALLILVPRHPERFDSVYQLCHNSGFSAVRRTSNQAIPDSAQIYLADTMGEMLQLLKAADVCFMGGSLIGNKVGGHNVLEPAALCVPTITGPSYFNFKEITEALIEQQGILVCQDSTQLADHITRLFNDQNERERIAGNALLLVEQNRGALAKTINLLQK